MKYLAATLLLCLTTLPAFAQSVHQLTVDGPIGPASANYLIDGLEQAADEQAQAVVIRLDTPGGLDQSMRDIVQAILGSPVPVIGYVSPAGARAASAGTYILYATDVAVMAPGTNLGAATPVRVGGGGLPGQLDSQPTPKADSQGEGQETVDDVAEKSASERKMVNDAVAYIRSLAELRGRNADWAEQAVRESVSLSAQAALERGVIDQMASNMPALLEQVATMDIGLEAQAVIDDRPPNWRHDLLATIPIPMWPIFYCSLASMGLFLSSLTPAHSYPVSLGALRYYLRYLPCRLCRLIWLGWGWWRWAFYLCSPRRWCRRLVP